MEYSASNLKHLEGLEPVRVRPGMYIGDTGVKGLHHILWEIVDNAIDEAANGFADTVEVELYSDGSARVTDNGRGVPVDMHPELKKTGIEMVFCMLHAGGKFDNDNYRFSGGLHGVGASVTNALSRELVVTVKKNGVEYVQKFHSTEINGKIASGVPDGGLTTAPCDKKERGTSVWFLPDNRVFGAYKLSFEMIKRRLRELAFLNGGIKFKLTDYGSVDENGKVKSEVYHFSGGIGDFVMYLNEGKTPLYDKPIKIERSTADFVLSVGIQHTDSYTESIFSYVNNIPTPEGGTHETGFKAAYTKVMNDFARQKGYLKEKQQNLMGEDFRQGMTAVVSIKMQNIQFEGQTKSKLGNPEVRSKVEGLFSDAMIDYLKMATQKLTDAIFDKAMAAAKERMAVNNAKNLSRKLNSVSASALIGKLSACSGKKAELNELFIVEGDSAGGSAKQGRDRSHQAILPLRGKPLNAEKKTVDKVLANEEIATIIGALGAGFDSDFNAASLKYHKVIILADADQDGAHIRAILLTFFYRYMRELLTGGYVYIGMPPLYKVENKGKIIYAYDDEELQKVLSEVEGRSYKLQRYKGLGEMNPEQLWETTLNPATRTLMRVTIEDAAYAEKMVTTWMGDDVEERKKYINTNANFNKADKFAEIGG